MRNMSIVMLVVAAVLGALAVVGVRALLLNSSQQTAQAQTAPPAIITSVVVASAPLSFGAEITAGMLREIPWASEERPAGSFQSINDIVSGDQRVALRAIAPGQLILSDQISAAGERAALSQFIGDNMRAVSIRVNEVSGAAGFILPGDFVDVLLTVDADNDPRQAATHVILQNIKVLAMDQVSDDGQSGGAVVARVATLEVGIEDGQRIALASSVGSLSLALRNDTAGLPDDGTQVRRTIRFSDLEPGSIVDGLLDGLASEESPYTLMTVTRETVSSSERVRRDEGPDSSGSDRGSQ